MEILCNTTINTYMNELEIKLAESGHAYCDYAWKQDNVHIPFSRLFYIIDGEAEIMDGNRIITLKPDTVYFIPFNYNFTCDCRDKMEKLYFHFNIPFLGKLDLFEGIEDVLSIPCAHINELIECYNSKSILDITKLKSYIYNDIVKFIELSGSITGTVEPYSPTVKKAIIYINENISSKLTANDVASALYVSKSGLSKLFSSEIGITIGKYITNKLIHEIEMCLIGSGLSTAEICERFDFCDQSYYIRLFKQKTGMTPGKFKNIILQKKYSK